MPAGIPPEFSLGNVPMQQNPPVAPMSGTSGGQPMPFTAPPAQSDTPLSPNAGTMPFTPPSITPLPSGEQPNLALAVQPNVQYGALPPPAYTPLPVGEQPTPAIPTQLPWAVPPNSGVDLSMFTPGQQIIPNGSGGNWPVEFQPVSYNPFDGAGVGNSQQQNSAAPGGPANNNLTIR